MLPFGSLAVPLNNLRISATTGLSFDTYQRSVDSGDWRNVVDVPLTDVGDARVRLTGTVTISRSGNSFSSTLAYKFGGWIITQECNPPFPFGDGKCTTHYPPANIEQAAPYVSGSGSIGADGRFSVNTPFAGFTSFPFGPFW